MKWARGGKNGEMERWRDREKKQRMPEENGWMERQKNGGKNGEMERWRKEAENARRKWMDGEKKCREGGEGQRYG